MKQFYQSLFLPNRFFYVFAGITLLFLLSFPFSILMPLALAIFTLCIGLIVIEIYSLYQKDMLVNAKREMPNLLSLSDQNTIKIEVENNATILLLIRVI